MKIPRLIAFCLLALSWNALALTEEQIRNRMAHILPEVPIESVNESTLPGFYEVALSGGQILFVTEDGKHFLTGDLYEISADGIVNRTEELRNQHRKELLSTVDESEMLVFAPPEDQIKATLTVFTDVDCGYCRKLHQEVPELNRMGIAIHYLAYPRAGIGSNSYDKIVSAWCADDPQKALTLAKLGQEIEPRTCENPVARQYELGNEIGVTGTPALVYEDGTLIPGYMPADRLAKRLGIN